MHRRCKPLFHVTNQHVHDTNPPPHDKKQFAAPKIPYIRFTLFTQAFQTDAAGPEEGKNGEGGRFPKSLRVGAKY
ncbi:hypothetical protein [Fluviicola chungangensis]|uniref:Uncharacterized protein n=1 Tax=Fluviicola chungangensis TaxID=2597671 RepID=A0A556MGY2_9FLAO|nr:hypothetical protein [Fluviicola chungangensis]TSJ39082.1 hypothetical protein FO442_18080 [Fluviicola chungangensis]